MAENLKVKTMICKGRRARALSLGIVRRLRFLASGPFFVRFLWPRPPQSDDASKKIVRSRLVGSRLRKKRARVKAQTLQIVVETSFRLKTQNAGIWSGLRFHAQGERPPPDAHGMRTVWPAILSILPSIGDSGIMPKAGGLGLAICLTCSDRDASTLLVTRESCSKRGGWASRNLPWSGCLVSE